MGQIARQLIVRRGWQIARCDNKIDKASCLPLRLLFFGRGICVIDVRLLNAEFEVIYER